MHAFQPFDDQLDNPGAKTNPEPPFPLKDGHAPLEASDKPQSDQRALDLVDEACMESFPCSDPPGYTRCHA